MFSITWRPWRTRFACSVLLVLPARAGAQQQEAVVEAVAQLLAAADARRPDHALFQDAVRHPDAIVRGQAALAIGRTGYPAGTTLLVDLLLDADSTVRARAAFALGLLRDPAAVRPLARLTEPGSPADSVTQAAAIHALARIGTDAAFDVFLETLRRAGQGDAVPMTPAVRAILGDAWRSRRPELLDRVASFVTHRDPSVRWSAIYSLGRARYAPAGNLLLESLRDANADVRAAAARELNAAFADSAGISRRALSVRLRDLLADESALVRTSALRTLASYRDSALAPAVVPRLADPDPNTRIQALATLGALGGPAAARALGERTGRGSFAQRRQALVALAQAAPDSALAVARTGRGDRDWRWRFAIGDALGAIPGAPAESLLVSMSRDADGRVAAAALASLAAIQPGRARIIARNLLGHTDPMVRAAAVNAIGAQATTADLSPLLDTFAASVPDPIPDARSAILRTLGRLASRDATVAPAFLRRFPRAPDYLASAVAQESFAALQSGWGTPFPTETGLEAGDYRAIARRLVWPAEHDGRLPGLTIETDRGTIGLSLFGADAPVTVNAILRLADRRYYDGGTWHRVVPGFVAQAGDPRGDGAGGPGFALRDEASPHSYVTGTVGMALDGPDSGGSQFFVTLAPQPHLDGTYTVIGRVDSGMDVLRQMVQGDRVRSIRTR